MRAWPQAILFDLYETLISEFDPARTPQPSLAAPRLGVEEAAFAEAWRQVYAPRMTGTLPDFPVALHVICQRLGATPDAAVIAHLHQERLAAKASPFTRIAVPIVRLIQRLHAMSIKLGVLSNAAPEEVAAWETCVLAPFFDTVVFSYQVELMKPDPQVYRLACERLGTTAVDTLFVGGGQAGGADVGGRAAPPAGPAGPVSCPLAGDLPGARGRGQAHPRAGARPPAAGWAARALGGPRVRRGTPAAHRPPASVGRSALRPAHPGGAHARE